MLLLFFVTALSVDLGGSDEVDDVGGAGVEDVGKEFEEEGHSKRVSC